MRKYQFITFILIALAIGAAIPAEANERGLFNEKQDPRSMFTEERKDIFLKKFDLIADQMNKAILKLENAATRTEIRISKIEESENKILTETRNKLDEVKNKIFETTASIQIEREEIKNSFESGAEISFEKIKSSVEVNSENIQTIKNLLLEILNQLK